MKKRALALVCAFVMGMTLSAGTGIGMIAKAADEAVATPAVTIKGATISKESGTTQSLRFLMEVENYDQIKVSEGQDFGMNIKVGDKTVPVSYKDYTNIYAVDETANTLQYVVDITGISAANIETNITATGFVKGVPDADTGAAANIAESEAATRTVKGVAEAASYSISVDSNTGNMKINKNTSALSTGYEVDLSQARLVYNNGSISFDKFSGAITAKDAAGIYLPIIDNANFYTGSDVEVTVYGSATGSKVRAWIYGSEESDKGTEINDGIELGVPTTFHITKDSKNLMLKAAAGSSFENLTITKIVVKGLPWEKPAQASEPYTLELSDSNITSSLGGNAVVNEDGTVTGKITGKWGNFGFSLPDDKVANYYDTVTIKFKDANYQGSEAGVCIGFDVVNGGKLTDEPYYGDYFKHLTEGTSVITAKGGPIKNVRVFTGSDAVSKETPYTFTIESVVFSDSRWIAPENIGGSVNLSEASVIQNGSDCISKNFADGKADIVLSYTYNGHGIRLLLNGEDGVDLSQYNVVMNYTAKGNYPIFYKLESDVDTTNDYWAYNATKINEGYNELNSGNNVITFSADSGTAKALYIKYNTYGSDRTDNAEFTINSIVFIKK